MKVALSLRIKVALRGIISVLKRPLFLLLALVVAVIVMGVILWSLNVELLWYIVAQSPLSLSQKIEFVFDVYTGITTNYESIQAMIMVLFSLLFGVNTALLVYVVLAGHSNAIRSKSSVGGLIAAVIGGGCIACGTSIITPLVASLGATATISLNNTIGMIMNIVGIVFISYSLYNLGQRAQTINAQ